MQYKDYYQILGVERGAGQDDVKRAYRRLARKYHPDVSKEADAEARFKEVGEAYEVLKDPDKRAAYDRLGAGWRAGQEFTPPPGWDFSFQFGDGSAQDGGFGFSEFFETLFGGGRGRHGPFHGGGFRRPGRDQRARIAITLEEAFGGGERTLHLDERQVDRHGQVDTRRRTLRVRIPKGVLPGGSIRLSGQGERGAGGEGRGDLHLEVDISPHHLYRVQGRDIYLNLPVAPWEAALGATIQVPTLGGPVDLKVPAGSQSGRRLRLKGRGLGSNPAGDQYVVLQIVTPPADSPGARELYERMARELRFNPRSRLES